MTLLSTFTLAIFLVICGFAFTAAIAMVLTAFQKIDEIHDAVVKKDNNETKE